MANVTNTQAEQKRQLVRLFEVQNEWDDIQAGKRTVLEELDIKPGWTVLDAGIYFGWGVMLVVACAKPG